MIEDDQVPVTICFSLDDFYTLSFQMLNSGLRGVSTDRKDTVWPVATNQSVGITLRP